MRQFIVILLLSFSLSAFQSNLFAKGACKYDPGRTYTTDISVAGSTSWWLPTYRTCSITGTTLFWKTKFATLNTLEKTKLGIGLSLVGLGYLSAWANNIENPAAFTVFSFFADSLIVGFLGLLNEIPEKTSTIIIPAPPAPKQSDEIEMTEK